MIPRVSVIVLNWNGISDTLKCIDSLKKQSFRKFEIIVVDNGSTKDDSVAILKKQKGITTVFNKENLGFAEGNNTGVRASKATDYIALLNNDATADKDWLKELVKVMDENSNVGQVASKIPNRYKGGEFVTPPPGTSTLVLQQSLFDRSVGESMLIPISAAGGGGLIYRKKLVKEPFDPDYFIYHEDSALGFHLHLMGYDALYAPKSVAYHEGEATIKREPKLKSRFVFLAERNRNMNLLIYYQWSTLIKLLPIWLSSFVLLHLSQPRKFVIRMRSYVWILTHCSLVMKKRSRAQQARKVPDRAFTRYYSSKIVEPRFVPSIAKPFARVINTLSRIYCKVIGIPVVENNWQDVMK